MTWCEWIKTWKGRLQLAFIRPALSQMQLNPKESTDNPLMVSAHPPNPNIPRPEFGWVVMSTRLY